MIFFDASVVDPKFVAPDVASEQQISLRLLPAMAQPPSRTLGGHCRDGGRVAADQRPFNGELSSADYWDMSQKSSPQAWVDNIIGVNELTEEQHWKLAALGTSLS